MKEMRFRLLKCALIRVGMNEYLCLRLRKKERKEDLFVFLYAFKAMFLFMQ